MSFTIDYFDKQGEHLGSNSLLNFTGKIYTFDHMEGMAKKEMHLYPEAVTYEISKMEVANE